MPVHGYTCNNFAKFYVIFKNPLGFPKHPLILSLGRVLPGEILFLKKLFTQFFAKLRHFFGNKICPGKISPKFKIRGRFFNAIQRALSIFKNISYTYNMYIH